MSNPIDWAAVRADFPILDQQVRGQPLIYFDNAASSQKPRAVIATIAHKFEAGTPNIAGAVGLGAAVDYLEGLGRAAIFAHDLALTQHALAGLDALPGVRVLGPHGERGGLAGFVLDAAHPHDLTTFADRYGLALRGGHHCNMPLMKKLRLPGTTRASFYFSNTHAEVDRMLEILAEAVRFFA